MITKFALAALLALAVCAPFEEATAQDPLGGAIVGGAAGAIVGGVVGGGRGAAVGAIVGATTGAAIAAQGQPRPGGYSYYRNGCYLQRPDGAYVAVSQRYCATAEYAPQPAYPGLRDACGLRPMIPTAALTLHVTAIATAAHSNAVATE